MKGRTVETVRERERERERELHFNKIKQAMKIALLNIDNRQNKLIVKL